MTYLAIKGPKTSDKGQIPTFSITFPSTSFQEVDVTLLPPPLPPLSAYFHNTALYALGHHVYVFSRNLAYKNAFTKLVLVSISYLTLKISISHSLSIYLIGSWNVVQPT